ncbi:MAG: NUDIX domain-containing protein [bacterium]|nr:NUDIX domain-containing protein [bacterium]
MPRFYQSVTTDIVIFTIENEELKVLLIKRVKDPFKNQWALPGGFLLKKEDPEKAAKRVLKDKAGIENVYLEQLYTFAGSGRDPRGNVITISYFALTPRNKIEIKETKEIHPVRSSLAEVLRTRALGASETSYGIQTPTFRSVKKLPDIAFDHNRIISYALKRLQSKLEYTNVVYSLLSKYFTFNQLQNAYEVILGIKLDKRNFRKKFLILGLIRPTNKILKGERQRPAKLYQFISRKPTELKKFF